MIYKQGDLVWLEHNPPLPDGKDLDHPVLIISNRSSNAMENFYTGVLCTTREQTDLYSFKLTKDMFEGHFKKENCQARMYIFASFRGNQIRKLENNMKKTSFSQLLRQIKDYVLSVD
jgi:hypothetical protein